MKIGIGNDHAAVEMKNEVVAYLKEKGCEVVNYGTDTHESCNYPEYGEKVGRAVVAGEVLSLIHIYRRLAGCNRTETCKNRETSGSC